MDTGKVRRHQESISNQDPPIVNDPELEARRGLDEAFTDDTERAYNRVLGFLSFRPRSRDEVVRYLHARKIPDEIMSAVIEHLEAAGFINDGEFAEYWTTNRQNFSPRGDRALRAELRQKGVARELVDEALEGLPEEEERALMAGARKLSSYARMDKDMFARRMFSFLCRRGFSFGVAHTATRQLWLRIERLPESEPDV